MIELTVEQRKAIAAPNEIPPRAVDPDTHTTYVLIREEVYDRARSLFSDESDVSVVRESFPHAMEVFGREGWDDRAMDIYDELDPRIQP